MVLVLTRCWSLIMVAIVYRVIAIPNSIPGFERGSIVTRDYTSGGCLEATNSYWAREVQAGHADWPNEIRSANFINLHTDPPSGRFDCHDPRNRDWPAGESDLYSYFIIECAPDERLQETDDNGDHGACFDGEEDDANLNPNDPVCANHQVEHDNDAVISWADKVQHGHSVSTSLNLFGSSFGGGERWASHQLPDGSSIVLHAQRGQVYRACAKLPPGHGNGRLRIASIHMHS